MDISVSELKQRCLEVIRRVERTGTPVKITRRGKVVARLAAVRAPRAAGLKPWERLRGMGGRCEVEADDSVIRAGDFRALR